MSATGQADTAHSPHRRRQYSGESSHISSPDMLHSIMERIAQLERYFQNMLHLQTQQSQKIGSLEVTVRHYVEITQQALRTAANSPLVDTTASAEVSPAAI
ncbi:hypothetical protein GGI12_004549, partial [Dipsacomyces acuminosporus]